MEPGSIRPWSRLPQECTEITKLANLVHKQVLSDERHVANLESLKDEFGIGTTAATTPGLLKAFMNVLYVREVAVIPQQLRVILPKDSGK